MKKILSISLLSAALLLLGACNDFLTEKPESFEKEDLPVTPEVAEAFLQSAFKALLWYKNDRPGMCGFSGTDEARGKTVEANYWAEQGALDKYNTSLNSDNWLTKWLWDSGYFASSRANRAIAAAREIASGMTAEEILSKEAEARFVRAVAYFHLTQYFGKVPVITEKTPLSSSPSFPREELSVVYKFIEDDLLFAETNLITAYRAGRPTVGAAKAMLMKLYMYAPVESGFRSLAKAKTKFEEVELLDVYELQGKYGQLFDPAYENGTESVYEFQFDYPDEPNKFQYCSGSRIIGFEGEGGGFAIYLPSDRYLALFQTGDGDERYEASVRTKFYDPKTGALITSSGDPEYIAPHCKKYEDFERNPVAGNSSKNIYFIRYADLILLYAECLNDAGDLEGARAQVKRVRDRAGAVKPITAANKTEMLDYIYEERMRELGMEGWRRWDLIRRGVDYFVEQTDKYNPFAKGNVKAFHAVYPIPANEIATNHGISKEDQNPGYF